MHKEQIGDLLPRRLKAARALSGMTVLKLSEETGIATHSLYRYERGDYVPDAVEIAAIATATGQTIGFFLEEEAAA